MHMQIPPMLYLRFSNKHARMRAQRCRSPRVGQGSGIALIYGTACWARQTSDACPCGSAEGHAGAGRQGLHEGHGIAWLL